MSLPQSVQAALALLQKMDLRFCCSEEGCAEFTVFRYETRRELSESYAARAYAHTGWRCSRHAKPLEVLGKDNMATEFEVASNRTKLGTFWNGCGFMHGPGFKAWAEDFPPGTKLIVTARIELPTLEPSGGGDAD